MLCELCLDHGDSLVHVASGTARGGSSEAARAATAVSVASGMVTRWCGLPPIHTTIEKREREDEKEEET